MVPRLRRRWSRFFCRPQHLTPMTLVVVVPEQLPRTRRQTAASAPGTEGLLEARCPNQLVCLELKCGVRVGVRVLRGATACARLTAAQPGAHRCLGVMREDTRMNQQASVGDGGAPRGRSRVRASRGALSSWLAAQRSSSAAQALVVQPAATRAAGGRPTRGATIRAQAATANLKRRRAEG